MSMKNDRTDYERGIETLLVISSKLLEASYDTLDALRSSRLVSDPQTRKSIEKILKEAIAHATFKMK